jgi:hypothetical protein
MSQAQASGDASDMTQTSLSTCSSCNSIVSFVKRSYENGGRIMGGELTVLTSASPPLEGDHVTATVILRQAAGSVLDSAGVVKSRIEALQRVDAEISLQWTGNAWRVARITQHVER